MKVVIHDGGRRISSREFARTWPMQHKHVLEKIREICENFNDLMGSQFRPQEFEIPGLTNKGRFATEFLMDWEGFWLLATSISGIKAMRARRELVESVKRALDDSQSLHQVVEDLQRQLVESERQARIHAGYAKEAASAAGRALAQWKQVSLAAELELAGQQRLALEIEYPDPQLVAPDDEGVAL